MFLKQIHSTYVRENLSTDLSHSVCMKYIKILLEKTPKSSILLKISLFQYFLCRKTRKFWANIYVSCRVAETLALSREARNGMRETFSQEITCEKCEKFEKAKSLETIIFSFFLVRKFSKWFWSKSSNLIHWLSW